MITDVGQKSLLEYIAGKRRAWITAVQIGTGGLLADGQLEYPIQETTITFGEVNDGVVLLRADLPISDTGAYYELAVLSDNRLKNIAATRLLVTNFSGAESYLEGNYTIGSLYARNGAQNVGVVTSGTETITLTNSNRDYSLLVSDDTFRLAYSNLNNQTTAVQVRMYNPNGDHWLYSFSPAESVYAVEIWDLIDFTPVGSPVWSDILRTEFTVVSAGSATDFRFDGMQAVKNIDLDDYGIVDSSVLADPVVVSEGVEQPIEYALEFSFNG